jgi:hypothetical protein
VRRFKLRSVKCAVRTADHPIMRAMAVQACIRTHRSGESSRRRLLSGVLLAGSLRPRSRRPRLALKAAAATPVPFAAAATALRRDRADIVAVTWIGPNWLAAMCAGLWYGFWLALRARFGRGEN